MENQEQEDNQKSNKYLKLLGIIVLVIIIAIIAYYILTQMSPKKTIALDFPRLGLPSETIPTDLLLFQ
jgi:flagellar basal body-associated protein FliL